MKRWIVLLCIVVASSAFGGEKRVSDDGRKGETARYEALQNKWNRDSSLLRFDESENAIFYGVEQSATISAKDSNLRSGMIAILYTPAGRKSKHHVAGSYYSVQNWNFDCKKQALNIDTAVFFDEAGGEVASFSENKVWEEMVPGSISDHIAKIICNIEADDATKGETGGATTDRKTGVPL